MQNGSAPSGTPLGVPPEILIFFHIPKTGGTTMDGVLQRCFPGPQHFDGRVGSSDSALALRSRAKIETKYFALSVPERQAIRCVMGTHYPMDIHTMLDRPAKYFALLRPPVERSASHIFDNRTQRHLPCYGRIKDLTLEQYLDSGLGIEAFDNQVRLLSGCPELDVPWDPAGGPISVPPVGPHHLELAKRNIEQHFITVAPLDAFTDLLLLLRRLYGWKLWQIMFMRHNVGAERATPMEPISPAARRRLEETNRYDIELYDWATARFARQVAAIDPDLRRDRRRFELLNGAAQRVRRTTPQALGKMVGRLLSPHRSA